jgi:hypothetical protein
MQGIVGMTMGGLTASQFRGLFFAALLPAQPDMTIADAGDLITLSNSPAIKDAIIEAYAASMPPAEDTKKSTAKSDPND